jgi:hypothetical protein
MKLIKDLTEEEFDDLLFFQTSLSNLDGIDIDDKIIVFNNPYFDNSEPIIRIYRNYPITRDVEYTDINIKTLVIEVNNIDIKSTTKINNFIINNKDILVKYWDHELDLIDFIKNIKR